MSKNVHVLHIFLTLTLVQFSAASNAWGDEVDKKGTVSIVLNGKSSEAKRSIHAHQLPNGYALSYAASGPGRFWSFYNLVPGAYDLGIEMSDTKVTDLHLTVVPRRGATKADVRAVRISRVDLFRDGSFSITFPKPIGEPEERANQKPQPEYPPFRNSPTLRPEQGLSLPPRPRE